MRTRATLLICFPIGIAAVLSAETPAGPLNPDTPNIIEIMTDDQGWNHAGYLNHPIIQTPNLDAMAAEGVVFSRFYSPTPVCSPTRQGMSYGLHASRWGAVTVGYVSVPPFHQPSGFPGAGSIAQVLRARGYATGHFSKLHTAPTLGMDVVYSDGNNDRCVYFTAKAIAFMEQSAGNGKPFYIRLWLGAGHKLFLYDPEAEDRSEIIMTPDLPMMPDGTTSYAYNTSWHIDNTYAAVPDTNPRKNYYAEISRADDMLGWVRDKVAALGLAGNTLIVFCSDNGGQEENGDLAPLRKGKQYLEEAGIRVPGVVYFPGMADGGRVIDEPASGLDLAATYFDLIGVPYNADLLDGTSLLPAFTDPDWERPKPIPFWYVDNESLPARRFALVDRRYKLLTNLDDPTLSSLDPRRTQDELYDIITDPSESTNLAAILPEVAERMKWELAYWRAGVIRDQESAGMSYWGDVARKQPASASSGVNPAYANDNRDATSWSADPADTDPEWLVDTGTMHVPEAVGFRTDSNEGIDFLEVYGFNQPDRSDWTLVAQQGSDWKNNRTDFRLSSLTSRGFRYFAVKRSSAASTPGFRFADVRIKSNSRGPGGDFALYQSEMSFPPGEDGPLDNPDADPFPNVIEYAVAESGMSPNLQPFWNSWIEKGLNGRYYQVFSMNLNPAAADLAIWISASSDLLHWTEHEALPASFATDSSGRLQSRMRIPLSDTLGTEFWRLRFTIPSISGTD